MKKLTTVLIAAGLIASASACSAQQQLTTKETCDRVGVAAAGIPQSPSQTATIRAANAIRPIEPVASTEMKPVVTAILEFLDEQAKDEPTDAAQKSEREAKLAELNASFQEAGTKYGELCRG
ncbi:hypothetical protein J2Y66_004252 [Paenarthrobacter nitroguajacolicus]|uniref:hypothetical protein n=1 Tax=Paenarthrobacter TaxID=1742992 RepID=UPI00285E008D|nr:hypothetical protein [Paenarthrobacter nitroguajacolicus]MDR6989735.1 hypothetical protein [Paenarthrobacter nitroguajacolicus]